MKNESKRTQSFKQWWLTEGKLLCGAKNEAQAKDIFNIGFKAAQLQAPVISAEEFLKEKGIAVDMNLNTCTKKPPKIKLTDLLNEYRNL